MNVFDPICTLIKMKCSWSCPCHEAALPAAQILVREGWRGVFVRPGLDLRSECECVLLPREPASNLLRSHPTLQPTLPQLCYKWEPASPCRLLPSPLKQSRHGWRAKNSKTTAPVSGGRSVRCWGQEELPAPLAIVHCLTQPLTFKFTARRASVLQAGSCRNVQITISGGEFRK